MQAQESRTSASCRLTRPWCGQNEFSGFKSTSPSARTLRTESAVEAFAKPGNKREKIHKCQTLSFFIFKVGCICFPFFFWHPQSFQ